MPWKVSQVLRFKVWTSLWAIILPVIKCLLEMDPVSATMLLLLVSQLWLTLCSSMVCSPSPLLCPWNFPGKNTGVGCQSLLQGIFLTQADSLPLSHQGTLWITLLHTWNQLNIANQLHSSFRKDLKIKNSPHQLDVTAQTKPSPLPVVLASCSPRRGSRQRAIVSEMMVGPRVHKQAV